MVISVCLSLSIHLSTEMNDAVCFVLHAPYGKTEEY